MFFKKQSKIFFQSALTVLISVLIIFTAVKAGNIAPPTGAPSAKFYTLSEIYNFIANNTAATEGGHSFTFSDNLEGTGRTLTDIYYALSHLISADKVKLGATYLNVAGTLVPSGGDAATADVCSIKKYFGANQTDWNLATGALTIDAAKMLDTAAYCGITGTIANCGSEGSQSCYAAGTYYAGTSKTPSSSAASQSAGYYPAFNLATVDADLITGNIKSGINLFGVNGDSNVVNTFSGDAVAGNILSDKKAWVDGAEITGSAVAGANVSGSNSSLSFTIPDGFYSGSKTCTASDTNLTISNIKKGTSVFGTNGAYSGFAGTGWTPNGSGNGSTALNQTLCESQGANWKWFEDANGDGDTTDPEDGICVKTATVTSDSWNGAEQMNSYTLADTTAASGTSNSATVAGTPWTADQYKNEIVKIISGTASPCWGIVKTNTNNTITVYGSWLQSTYAACVASPDATSHIQVFDDNKYDNSFIGDYSCSGNFPSGTVTLGSYPSSGTIALAVTDCYDGKRDLLPNEQDRAVLTGTATSADATSITDSAQALSTNVWLGQKVLITGGTGNGSSGIVESNTATALTVAGWSGTAPAAGSTFKIIYILPRASYIGGTGMSQIIGGTSDDTKANQGPLMEKQLKEWTGTKLPTSQDFFGFCGAASGASDSTAGNSSYSASGASANKTIGNYGSNVGRGNNASPNDEYMNLSNSGSWEWLSEQHTYNYARVAGNYACSYFNSSYVYYSYRFRAVFRP